MNKDQATAFLKAIDVDVPSDQPRTGWVISKCPLGQWNHDGGQSSSGVFGVKLVPGDPPVNCFSCGFHGTASELLIELKAHANSLKPGAINFTEAFKLVDDLDDEIQVAAHIPNRAEMMEQPSDFYLFPEQWLITFPKWRQVPFAVQYLAERGVPPAMADELDIRADTFQKRICFPVRDFKGRLVGFHGRAVSKQTEPRYRMYLHGGKCNPMVWYGENWVDLDKPIVVVEGPFDVTSVMRVYPNVVSPLFASPSYAKLLRMNVATKWVTFFDRGTGGDVGRGRISRLFKKGYSIQHVMPPEGVKDPGVCTVDQIREVLSSALPDYFET